ncbi:allophanate hydrolase-related protein [Oscillatoria salina]|uniref:allophanate hydrolase-related protein n=1 Tax=Oscillatoria salina TaxID=331517 RepID=UPI0013B9A856|nr:gamma-glutamylcyclotransferase [Oscillatoria salina]MBZ8182370.1 gamma-glutamylcyclotransferase [Oscillatoria salina IIICB1]NET90161.1 gamma-glutamylcyclotransferase [Kamptonema sp. SIO1D9]
MTTTKANCKRVFICGSALKGQPDHGNLQSAKFIKKAQTRPLYRLHAAAEGWHPAIYQVEEGGISIPGEVYELTSEQYEHLVSTEPPNMYPGDVVLEDGEVLTAMLYPRELVEKYNWLDISDYGGWAAYKEGLGIRD